MTIETELLQLFDGDGLIKAQTVVDWAKANPDSELYKHREFYWEDDARAAKEHRMNVARTLIRVHIQTDDGDRATISLLQDRRTGGGYRQLGPVLSNSAMRAMAVKQALREFRAWERRYNHLRELAAVFEAAREIDPPEADAA